MYIVRRSFRGPKGPMSAGSVVEPAAVKNFRYRLQEKHIIEVTEQNFERYSSFFKQRFGVDIPKLDAPVRHMGAVAQVVVKPATLVETIQDEPTPVAPEAPQEEATPVEPEAPQEEAMPVEPEAPQEEAPIKSKTVATKAKTK